MVGARRAFLTVVGLVVIAAVRLPLSARISAQEVSSEAALFRRVIRGFGQYGPVVQQSGFLRGTSGAHDGIPDHIGGRLEIGWQTDGSSLWHRSYRLPTYGVGIYHATYGNDRELGRPVALYGWFSWPLAEGRRIRFASEWALGAAANWMEFDPETNPRNTSISLPFSAFVEAGLSATIQVGNRWDVLGGLGLTHFSNGALREPNVGLNQMSIRLGIQRHFGRIIPFDGGGTDPPGGAVPPLSVRSSALAEPASTWSFFSRLGGGVRSVRFDRSDPVETSAYFGESYPVFTVMQLFRRSIGSQARVGAGIDVTYDRSTDERRRIVANRADPPLSDHDLSLLDRSGVSMLVGYDQVIGGLSAGIRLGYVVLRSGQLGSDPRFFQEVAFDWSVGPSFSIGVDARFIEFSRSIFLDWGLGYRFGGDG